MRMGTKYFPKIKINHTVEPDCIKYVCKGKCNQKYLHEAINTEEPKQNIGKQNVVRNNNK